MPTTFTFLTFEQWKAENPDLKEIPEECELCGGSGIHECPDCGDSHDCGACQGSGKVVEVTIRQMYNSQRKRDEERLQAYLARIERANTGSNGRANSDPSESVKS